MKSYEQIKNEIQFSLDNKKLNGFIEKDYLYVECPRIYFSFIIFLLTVPIFGIGILAFIAYLGYRLRYFYWIPVTYLLLGSILCKLCKDYIVFDYNRGQIYFSTKLYNTTIWTGYYLDVRSIKEIGIDNEYLQQPPIIELKNKILKFFNKITDDEIIKKVSKPNLVYLDSEGKKKKIFDHYYEKDFEENFKNYCEIIGSILEIPVKICNINQQLNVATENNIYYLKIIPFDIKTEKRKIFLFNLRLFFIQLSIPFVLLWIVAIFEYGFIGSLYYLAYIIKLLFTEYIPRKLGLK